MWLISIRFPYFFNFKKQNHRCKQKFPQIQRNFRRQCLCVCAFSHVWSWPLESPYKASVNKHEKSSRSPGRQCKQLCWVLSKAKLNNKIIYTSLYCISNIVFNCFMSSLICAHAATDSDFPSTCIPFPVLISHIHFWFILILLVTLEVISHKRDW